MRFFSDFGRFVITNMGVQRRYQHQRLIQQLADSLAIRLNAHRAVLVKALHAIGQQTNRLQYVVDHHRTIDVKLEVTRRAAHVNRHVITHHLTAQHGHGFALGRVHFTRHNGAARLVFRNADFADAAARAGGQPAHVVGNFHQRGRKPFQRAMGMHQRITGRQRFEFIRSGNKRLPGDLRQLFGHAHRVLGMGV